MRQHYSLALKAKDKVTWWRLVPELDVRLHWYYMSLMFSASSYCSRIRHHPAILGILERNDRVDFDSASLSMRRISGSVFWGRRFYIPLLVGI